jgi:hypothetical protein
MSKKYWNESEDDDAKGEKLYETISCYCYYCRRKPTT